MRPRLHADTLYMPVADGVYLRNNRSHLTMKGKSIYRWLESLVPYFNGQYELEEITSELDIGRKAMVTGLVETLCNNSFLSDASLDQPHTLSKEELDIYTSEIAFIESFQSSAARRFEGFRHMRVLVIGSGVAFSACVRSCLHSGIKHLSTIRTAEEATVNVYPSVDDARLFLPRDSSQDIEDLSLPRWDDRSLILETIQPFDAILHISDCPMLARTRLLNELCVEQQKMFLQACFIHDRAWVGPLVAPGAQGCWECAWHRLQSNIQESEQSLRYALEDQNTVVPDRRLAFPTVAIAANQLVFLLFKSVALADLSETASQMISIDMETLNCKSHSFLPHLHCQSCQHPSAATEASFLQHIEQLEKQEPLDIATFSKQTALCFNNQLGIFRSIDEGSFEQVPLAMCKVEISNPMAPLSQPLMQSTIAAGIDFQNARQRCTQRACEVYASTAVDSRRLVTQVPAPDLVLAPERFLTTTHLSTVETWSWALDLQTRKPYLVPAFLAFPSLQLAKSTGLAAHGIGSGMSWSEALCQALLDWVSYLTVAQLNDRQHPATKVDLHSISWTAEGAYLLSLLIAARALPDIYDVTSPSGVPTFAICMSEQIVTYVSHCDGVQALSSGLELALQHFQSHVAQQPEYDITSGPYFPPSLRSDSYSRLQSVSIPQAWSARLVEIQQKLREQGWSALAIPLNHDPALEKLFPFLVRVLLVRGESEK